MCRIENYPRNLEMLVNNIRISKYLEAPSKSILINRARQLRHSIGRGKKWSFSIPIETPLTFKENNSKLKIDVSCYIEGIDGNIQKLNINLRIWSCDKEISYREEIDSLKLKKQLENLDWKRVILRFHFDLKDINGDSLEPLFHFHVGGNQLEEENFWMSEKILVPRFPHPPLDIILLYEFILLNFFPEEYRKIKQDPEWISLVRKSQEIFQRAYLEECVKCINNENDTLLGKLVSSRGIINER